MKTANTLPAPVDPFAGFGDDLAAFEAENTAALESAAGQTFTEICRKCNGTGRVGYYRDGGVCYACKGAGKFERKTSPEQRAKAKANAAARKEKRAAADWIAFSEANPIAAQWIIAKRESFGFAESMYDAVRKFGDLTPNQLAAVERMVAADAERDAARAVAKAAAQAREANAPTIVADKLAEAFANAKASGLKFPKLILAGFQFKPAGATSRNPGAIYAVRGETYLGKVTGGKFVASRDCDDATAAAVIKAVEDPAAAAKTYGLKTGVCSCCGRELTNAESIELGIGPICREKWGF